MTSESQILLKNLLMKNSIEIKLTRLSPLAKIPEYQSAGAAACDLCAAIESPTVIKAGERMLIPTGLAAEPISDSPVALLIFPRSGLASKHGISLSNGVGVVDMDYRGEIKAALVNTSGTDYTITPGERIAQLMVIPILTAHFTETDSLSQTERGDGGFGHSGR